MRIKAAWSGKFFIPYGEAELNKTKKLKVGAIYEHEFKNTDTRTIKQNSSIHLWCSQIAETLNNSGKTIEKVIKVDVEWTMITVKEIIFKSILKALYKKDSTTKLNKQEFELLIDTITSRVSGLGVELPPFPNKEDLYK